MAFVTIKPTRFDKQVAKAVSRTTGPGIEETAKVLTWGADEHFLLAASAIFWLASRRSDETVRRAATHCLVTTVAASALPHLVKTLVDQERPDRQSFANHRRGIPVSGDPKDAFPSGHALHMGALASIATLVPGPLRYGIWSLAALLMVTRVVLLAHWVTDVAVGFTAGIALERVIRRRTHPSKIIRTRRRV